VSEWLDLMLDEIARKKREAEEAEAERQRRSGQADEGAGADEPDDQSK
jgi:hypothetical protein